MENNSSVNRVLNINQANSWVVTNDIKTECMPPWTQRIDSLSVSLFGDIETCGSFVKLVESKMSLHLHVYYDDSIYSNRGAALFLTNIMSYAVIRSGTPFSDSLLKRLSTGINAYCYNDENFTAISKDPVIDALFRSAYELACYADFFTVLTKPFRDQLSRSQLVDLDKKFKCLLKHILSINFIENLKTKDLLAYPHSTTKYMLSFERELAERRHHALCSSLSKMLHLTPYDLLALTLSIGEIKAHVLSVRRTLRNSEM